MKTGLLEDIAYSRERLKTLELRVELCGLGDRPQSPGVDTLREIRELRDWLAIHDTKRSGWDTNGSPVEGA